MDILVDAEYGVIKSVDEIDAVGHRVLHGGDKFVESCIVTDACKEPSASASPRPAPQPRQPHGHRSL